MKKLTVEEMTASYIKGGDWGDTINGACGGASAMKYFYGIGNNLVSGFCLGWGLSKLIYK